MNEVGAIKTPKWMPRKGALKGAGQRIFDSARELFYQRGVRAVGVDEIVCAAGVTKPSLYRSYASKDDLVTACLEKYVEDAEVELQSPRPATIRAPGFAPLSAIMRRR